MAPEMTIAFGETKKLPTAKSYVLRIIEPWLEIELAGEDGKPIGEAAYKVTLADGSIREGKLTKEGKARLDDLPPGPCKVTFPEFDAASYERAPEPPADAAPAPAPA